MYSRLRQSRILRIARAARFETVTRTINKGRNGTARGRGRGLGCAAPLFVGAAKRNTDPIKALELPNSPLPARWPRVRSFSWHRVAGALVYSS